MKEEVVNSEGTKVLRLTQIEVPVTVIDRSPEVLEVELEDQESTYVPDWTP